MKEKAAGSRGQEHVCQLSHHINSSVIQLIHLIVILLC